jgi:glycosyltransferase involved in cell wall biosynthesis
VDITVAICTWNRASSLAATLESCTALDPGGAGAWELLLIDNNSTDATPDVAARYGDRLPLRYVFESRQGLSNARNRAITEAAGGVVLWTDDDVLVGRRWLAAYADAVRLFPDAAFFGGPIEAEFAVPPPDWLRDNLDLFQDSLALRHLGTENKPILQLADTPNGANMAMRREALRQHLFDPTLGRIGAALLGGEEKALFERFLTAGLTGMWIGGAPVRHVIPPERMTLDYVRAYFQGIGRTKMLRLPAADQEHLARKLLAWRWRLLGEKLRLRFLRRGDAAWARTVIEAARLEGRIAALTAKPA